jgi:hypothetical protein
MGRARRQRTFSSPRKDGRQIDAELRGQGEHGWELQLLRDGEVHAERQFNPREQAVGHGEEIREELTAWMARTTTPERRPSDLATPRRDGVTIPQPTLQQGRR